MAGRVYNATWGRLFSACYDRAMARTEQAGLAARRAELLGAAQGRTLELGAGTGANVSHYPDAVTELVLTEPDPLMAKRLRRKVQAARRAAEVIEAPGERLPLPDSDFDTVVLTLVLCTVPNQRSTLEEILRVLKPGGRLLFIEHVRSHKPRAAKWQDRLERPWMFIADGCHCNRDTLASIAEFMDVEKVDHGTLPKAAPLVKPLISGSARPPSS